jgi:hypothetical protein
MFKVVRRRQEHTGGRDGDDDSDDEDEAEEDNDGEDGKEGSRKRPAKTARARFSKKTLDGFEESVYYRLIDNV